MIEIREVLRLRGEGLPKKRIAAQLGLDPKTVRRYLDGGGERRCPRDRRDQRRGGPPGAPRRCIRPAGRRAATAGRGVSSSARRSRAGWATACASPRFASCWCGRASTSRIRRCIASRSSSCSLARRRRRSRCSMASRATSCRSIRAGSAGSRCRSKKAAVSRLDLYRGPLAPPLRLPHLRGNDGARDRGVRGRVGVLRRRLHASSSRITRRRSSSPPIR